MLVIPLLALVTGTIAQAGYYYGNLDPSVTKPFPSFVLDHTPIVRIHAEERWWPSKVTTHLSQCAPQGLDQKEIPDRPSAFTTRNMDFTPRSQGFPRDRIFFTSNDSPFDDPAWMLSEYGKPNQNRSDSPAHFIVVDKNASVIDTVDVFYYMFFSYHHGGHKQGHRRQNTVGDWQSVVIRFVKGVPQSVHLSDTREGNGLAYDYNILQKEGDRIVVFAEQGVHWMRADPWDDYNDDESVKWDLLLNYNGFWFSELEGFKAAPNTSESINYLTFTGHWGDQQWPKHRQGQSCTATGSCRIEDGPRGPITRNLLRLKVCTQPDEDCEIIKSL